ncbi:MAG: serine/threonine kinase [Myxococcales bacterium]|nr:serine/threonine kinase [Myxococcales bacterium]
MIRPAWAVDGSEEETRAYLQARLEVFSKMMFWSFIVLISFLFALYAIYPELKPLYSNFIFTAAAVELATMAAIWRLLLARRVLSLAALHWIDLLYAIGIGVMFGISAYFAPELHAAAWTSLVFSTLAVFTRALFVPSSGKRTAVVSSIMFTPLTVAAIALTFIIVPDLPTPAYILGDLIVSSVVVLVATAGSKMIYGLRRQVTAATQLGQYTLERKIGEGGMGAVYRAHHVLLRRPTAVKLLLPDRVGSEDNLIRFEREVQHMSQLTHPNTVAVFDYGRSYEGVFYYAMEYLGGGINLEHLVKRHGPQANGRVAKILIQVCGALQEAHDRSIIHRDIKPPNIILCERGGMPDVVKVVDFGLVKEIAGDTGASTQVILGTPGYVAPEAITDPDRIGPGADLYAVGCVAYFLLTGKRVFDGATAIETCIQHVTAKPKRPSEVIATHVDPALEDIVMKCLQKTPAERHASAADLADALRALPTRDWTEADAKKWWVEFKAHEEAFVTASETPTRTMTIDLAAHEHPSAAFGRDDADRAR